MTSYVILRRTQKDPSAEFFWQEIGEQDAGTPAGAVRAHLNGLEQQGGGVFIAVPARSWRPMTFAVEQVRRVSVVDGAAE